MSQSHESVCVCVYVCVCVCACVRVCVCLHPSMFKKSLSVRINNLVLWISISESIIFLTSKDETLVNLQTGEE